MTQITLRARKTLLVNSYPNLFSIIEGRYYRLPVESEEAAKALAMGLLKSGLFELVVDKPEIETRGSLPLGLDFLEALHTVKQI